MKCRLMYVEWVDSSSFEDGWQRVGAEKNLDEHVIKSVGWLIRETKRVIIIAAHHGGSCFCGEMCIPKVAIRRKFEMAKP